MREMLIVLMVVFGSGAVLIGFLLIGTYRKPKPALPVFEGDADYVAATQELDELFPGMRREK